MKLKFRRDSQGVYTAQDDTKRYRTYKAGEWVLQIQTLATTAGVRHTLGQPIELMTSHETLKLAKGIAQHFSDLTDDYKASENGHAERHTMAIVRAYKDERRDLVSADK